MRRLAVIVATLATLVVIGSIYYYCDPAASRWFPRCPFLTLTGWQCPGCGSQRAVHALLGGDVAAAWRHNAALVVAIPLLILYLLGEMKRKSWPRFYALLNHSWVIIAILAAVVCWWALRNL